MPYFGFQISDLCPEADLYLRTVSSTGHSDYIRENFAQECWPVCYASQWGDHWLRGIRKFIPEFNIDGMYMDGTLSVPGCINKLHGHDRSDFNGRHLPYFSVLEMRRFSQLLHQITRGYKSDFLLYLHTSQMFIPATMGFIDVILNGEQTKAITGAWTIPFESFMAQFNGRQIGIPQQILSYDASSRYRREFSCSLLFDEIVTPWTISQNPHIVFTQKIWKLFDKYQLDGKYFIPFYAPESKIKDTTGNTFVSYYDTPEHLVIVISNYQGEKPVEACIDLAAFSGQIELMAKDILGDKKIPINNNSISIQVEKEDFKLIVIKHKMAS